MLKWLLTLLAALLVLADDEDAPATSDDIWAARGLI